MKRIKLFGREMWLMSGEERDSLERAVNDLYHAGRVANNNHKYHVKCKDVKDTKFDKDLDDIMVDLIADSEDELVDKLVKAKTLLYPY